MANDKFNLQRLLDYGLSSEDDEKVIIIFQSALQSLSEETADEQARDVASQLQRLVSSEKPITQFGSTWEAFLSVARNIPYRDHEGQGFIIKVIRVLVATPPWGDLPGLAQVMRTNWSGLVEWESFVIWQMRQALEEDLSPNAATDLRLSVASEWAIHAGPVLLRKCLVERRDVSEGDKRSRGPGPLYTGQWGIESRTLGILETEV
ncbi:hypothetical protein ACRE_055980 [Hapsidospora chrysogenum ATCC 11550]|uniref:Uncharacterized protein n=1 Tax=Hapsidospora chrysogenum (strain ATCC 11550 / CBS 779.69 / DSM 880 / IAM 14645 / JCM 23072 / IMI 49137) TaxID=857340 RepID=A0A086T2P8_HAPC1|nr:hypothetical protein ACRE_055980 [Hapsidospora chrysogenum ATCC 11550]